MSKPSQESSNRLIDQARKSTGALLSRAAAHYGIPIPRVDIHFNLHGKSAGQVRFPHRGRPIIRYNPQLLQENGQRFLERTLPHEVAHVIAHRLFGRHIRPHGAEWRAIMGLFEADDSRCHDYDTSRSVTRRLSRHLYRCGCREHALTSIRHNRILAGQRYYCRACGRILKREK